MSKNQIKTAVYFLSNLFKEIVMRCDLVCLGILMSFVGGMLIMGEWLCMEIAFRCFEYSTILLVASTTMIIFGVVLFINGLALKYAEN